MSAIYERDITPETISAFDPNTFMPPEELLDQKTRGGIIQFARNTIKTTDGPIQKGTVKEFVGEISDFEQGKFIKNRLPFRYMPGIDSPKLGLRCTAEDTVRGAISNMRYLKKMFGEEAFSVVDSVYGMVQPIYWQAPIDERYSIRIRGGSGAGSFSVDFGLGETDPDRPHIYKELWRGGIDTYDSQNGFGSRFIRTGSGVKRGDENKTKSFENFRKQYGMLPQRFLGVLGLYFMRELDPDYALAPTTFGAKRLSTLGNSKGGCDYSGIFSNIGFKSSGDPNWLAIDDFESGFYDALDLSKIRKNEADLLNHAVESVNAANGIDIELEKTEESIPFKLCSDDSRETVEKELGVYLPSLA